MRIHQIKFSEVRKWNTYEISHSQPQPRLKHRYSCEPKARHMSKSRAQTGIPSRIPCLDSGGWTGRHVTARLEREATGINNRARSSHPTAATVVLVIDVQSSCRMSTAAPGNEIRSSYWEQNAPKPRGQSLVLRCRTSDAWCVMPQTLVDHSWRAIIFEVTHSLSTSTRTFDDSVPRISINPNLGIQLDLHTPPPHDPHQLTSKLHFRSSIPPPSYNVTTPNIQSR